MQRPPGTREMMDIVRVAGPIDTARAPGLPIEIGPFPYLGGDEGWPKIATPVNQRHGTYDTANLTKMFNGISNDPLTARLAHDLHDSAVRYIPPHTIKNIAVTWMDLSVAPRAVYEPHIDDETDEHTFTAAVGFPTRTHFYPDIPADKLDTDLTRARVWTPALSHGALWRDRSFIHAVPPNDKDTALRRIFMCLVFQCDKDRLARHVADIERNLRTPVPA